MLDHVAGATLAAAVPAIRIEGHLASIGRLADAEPPSISLLFRPGS